MTENQTRYYGVSIRDPVSGEYSDLLKLPSVTSIIRWIAKPGLVKWANSLGKSGKDSFDESSKAMTRGTDLHDYFRDLLTFGELPPQNDTDNGYVVAINDWFRTHKPRLVGGKAEFVTCSLEHLYAGRVDACVSVGKKRILVDLKTTTASTHFDKRPFLTQRIQLEAYARAEAERGNHTEGQYVLRVAPDGRYAFDPVAQKPQEHDSYWDAFLGALEVWRAHEEDAA